MNSKPAPDHCDLCQRDMKHARVGKPDLFVCDDCRVAGMQRNVSYLQVGISR